MHLLLSAAGETIPAARPEDFDLSQKYRQHGYNDRDREDSRKGKDRDAGEKSHAPSPKRDNTFGPRPVNLPGTRALSRCTQCGTVLPNPPSEKCPKCAFDLHSCKQCMYFDPGSRFECTQPIPVRIAKKDMRNDCSFYEIRVTREKETSTPAGTAPISARQAFENLFKK